MAYIQLAGRLAQIENHAKVARITVEDVTNKLAMDLAMTKLSNQNAALYHPANDLIAGVQRLGGTRTPGLRVPMLTTSSRIPFYDFSWKGLLAAANENGWLLFEAARRLERQLAQSEDPVQESSDLAIVWCGYADVCSGIRKRDKELNAVRRAWVLAQVGRAALKLFVIWRYRVILEEPLAVAATRSQEMQDAGSQDRKALNLGEAAERLAYLEDNRPAPVGEMHLRPGGRIEEYVHFDAAGRREAEISLLKAFVKAHDGPDDNPDHEPRLAAEQDFDEGFELSF